MTFRYTDPDGDRLHIDIDTRDGGVSVLELGIHSDGSDSLAIHVDLDRVEELIAGIRDTARQAAGGTT